MIHRVTNHRHVRDRHTGISQHVIRADVIHITRSIIFKGYIRAMTNHHRRTGKRETLHRQILIARITIERQPTQRDRRAGHGHQHRTRRRRHIRNTLRRIYTSTQTHHRTANRQRTDHRRPTRRRTKRHTTRTNAGSHNRRHRRRDTDRATGIRRRHDHTHRMPHISAGKRVFDFISSRNTRARSARSIAVLPLVGISRRPTRPRACACRERVTFPGAARDHRGRCRNERRGRLRFAVWLSRAGDGQRSGCWSERDRRWHSNRRGRAGGYGRRGLGSRGTLQESLMARLTARPPAPVLKLAKLARSSRSGDSPTDRRAGTSPADPVVADRRRVPATVGGSSFGVRFGQWPHAVPGDSGRDCGEQKDGGHRTERHSATPSEDWPVSAGLGSALSGFVAH